jgi:hypothetical protein
LPSAGKDVIGTAMVAHFGRQKASVTNDNGACRGSNLLDLAHVSLLGRKYLS